LVKEAFERAATAVNAPRGFYQTGIWPFNPWTIDASDFDVASLGVYQWAFVFHVLCGKVSNASLIPDGLTITLGCRIVNY